MSPLPSATLSRPGSQSAKSARPAASGAPGRPGAGKRVPGTRKIVNNLLAPFSRQLSAMLSSGMSIVPALETLESQTDNPNFKNVVYGVRRELENGSAFSDALRNFPGIFDDLYCNMVRGGETGGHLPESIARLASFLESSAKLKRKVKSAMMYPTVVLCLALALATGMVLFIVPVFGNMFKDFGRDLPGPTQFLLDLSSGLRRFGIYILTALIAGGYAFFKWQASPEGAFALDGIKLRVPVFGELTRKVASARFARTFGQLLRSGVPILTALQIAAGSTGNRVAGAVILKAREFVEKGEPLSNAMINQAIFPAMLTRMLQAGEKMGKVDDMMDNIAAFYEDEVETMLAGLTTLLEPILMVFIGLIVGSIVLCIFMPIFKMGEVVSGR